VVEGYREVPRTSLGLSGGQAKTILGCSDETGVDLHCIALGDAQQNGNNECVGVPLRDDLMS
jgi:hypothetical protein